MNRRGFTLVEILLVVVIIGIMLAVILPRGLRANIETKYNTCRQNASELVKWGQEWAETELKGQNETGTSAILADYFAYLCNAADASNPPNAAWVARDEYTRGWRTAAGTLTGRKVGAGSAADVAPSGPAETHVPVDKILRNPFNGQSVFSDVNDPVQAQTAVPGALASGFVSEQGGWRYYGVVFQGTEDTGTTFDQMHANMIGTDLAGLRNGVFMARAKKGGGQPVP